MAKQKQRTNQDGKGGKLIIGIGAFIILALVIVIIVLLVTRNDNSATKEVSKREVLVNKDNAEKVVEELQKQETVRGGYYEATMNSTWYFENGTSKSKNAYVENVKNNRNDVYFDVFLAESNELIYSSPVIPIGSHLDDITLDKDLDAGTYDCILTYHTVDEEQNTLGKVSVSVTIIVEN